MDEVLLLSMVQLAFGLIVASTLGLLIFIIRDSLDFTKSSVEQMHEFDSAEVLRTGAWQYDHIFFDKITEFRNDFS